MRTSTLSAICISLLCLSVAHASVAGDLKTTTGSAVLTVTINSIVFGTDTTSVPPGANEEVAGGTTLTCSGCPLTPGTAVNMQNLFFPPPLPIANWMTFPTHPNLTYTLSGEGPGSSNTNCAGLANFGTCSAFAGDPVVLELFNGTTIASLSLNGTVTDGVGLPSIWNGSLTANLVNPLPDGSSPTPGNIQNYFATHPNGSLLLGSAGDFVASVTPEPGTLTMFGLGLLVISGVIRFRTRVRTAK